MRTILEIAHEACDDSGLSLVRPPSLFETLNDGDSSAQKLLRALHRTTRDLAASWDWQALRREQVWATTASEVQKQAIPHDFLRFVPSTFKDRTRRREVYGPLSPQDWSNIKAINIAQATLQFVQRGNDIHLAPVPPSNIILAFEYITNSVGWSTTAASNKPWSPGPEALPPVAGSATWGAGYPGSDIATASSGTPWSPGAPAPVLAPRPSQVPIRAFTADTNVPMLDDELVLLGVIMNYRKGEGLDHSMAEFDFERMKMDRIKQDGGRRMLDMSGSESLSATARLAAMKSATIVIGAS